MPVTPRGSGYQATVHHQGQRYRKLCRSRSEAEAWELSAKAALLRGEPVPDQDNKAGGSPAPGNLNQLLELTRKRYWAGRPGEKTAVVNATKCVEALGEHLTPAAVTEQRIDEMVFKFETEGVSDSTINRRLSALSKMLTFASERGYIARKPKIERKKEAQHRIRYLSADEEAELLAFFEYIGQETMRDLCIVGIDTGMRIGEILRIEGRDIDHGMVSIWRTKNSKSRSVPLTSRAENVIQRRSETLSGGKLFEGVTNSIVNHYWNQARRHLALTRDPQFVPHAMRHTFCSRLVQRGVDIVSVSKLAGHSSIVVTMRYAHLAPDNLVNAIKKLEDAA